MRDQPGCGLVFVVSAPSGAGKTSLVKALLQQDSRLVVSVSHTTRPQRQGEQNGVNYHFVSNSEFDDMVANGDFLEHAKVFGHQYGTARASLDDQLASGRDVVLEIDWQGAEQIRRAYPQCISIFILPPSRQALAQRLQTRGQDSAEVMAQRTAKAVEEMTHHASFDFLVVNDDFDSAVADLKNVIDASRLGNAPQRHALASLLDELLKTP